MAGAALFRQIVVASALGVATGLWLPHVAMSSRWTADLFLRLVVMAVGPLMFCVVVSGIVGAGSLRMAGRLGGRALLYFEAMTTLALTAALAAAAVLRPGAGLHLMARAQDQHLAAQYAASGRAMHEGGIGAFLLGIVPRTPVSAFADGNILQILLMAIVIGCGCAAAGAAAEPLVRLIGAVHAVFARIMRAVIALAPIGVFGAMATTTAQYGLGTIIHLAGFVALYSAAVMAFVVVVLGGALRWAGVSPWRFWRYFRAEILIVAATTASDSVLATIMAKLEAMGCERQVVGLVVPAGYSFNLDALSIYLGMSIMFLAQASGVTLSAGQITSVLAVALLTSKGAHGVPGMGIVILAATLTAIPAIPPSSIALLLAVDWFVGIARAVGNLCGNCVAPVVIAAWDGRLDRARAARVLSGR